MTNADDLRGVTAADNTTKARIERAAINLFAQRGIDAVTTREIAAESGVSEGAIYRHFPSKAALSETMFFAIHQKLGDAINSVAAENETIDEQARAIVDLYCHAADDDWALFSYHLLTAHRFLPAAPRSAAEKSNPVIATERLIKKAMDRGDLTVGDAALKASMALGVVLQAALHKIYGRVAGNLSNRKKPLTDAVIAVLKS